MVRRLAALALLVGLAPGAGMACGPDVDCPVARGTYRISLPDGPPAGAIVFAHGYRGSAAGVMQNNALRAMAADRGLALIALNSRDDAWDLANAPSDEGPRRDEMAYLDAVMADAADRFGISPADTLVTGFSAGGMFVWTAACERGDRFLGFAPYSGTFWRGPPDTCPATAADIVHIHGDDDGMVPIAGRPIADTWQGDVTEVLEMYRQDKGYQPDVSADLADMACEIGRTEGEKTLALCIFAGGHSFSVERLGAVYDFIAR